MPDRDKGGDGCGVAWLMELAVVVLSMAAIRLANRSFVKFFSPWFTALHLLPSIASSVSLIIGAAANLRIWSAGSKE